MDAVSAGDGRERVTTRAEAREIDRWAIEDYGLPSSVLMENAGRAAALVILQAPALRKGPCVVLCGCGNNGGDGLVIARTLALHARQVRVLVAGDEAALGRASADVQRNLRLWRTLPLPLGSPPVFLGSGVETQGIQRELEEAEVLVDALFGTGLTRPIQGLEAALVRAMNAAPAPVVAVDMPSGIDTDTGEVLGEAVRATRTLTFVNRKRGQLQGAGPAHCGRITTLEIGFVPPAE